MTHVVAPVCTFSTTSARWSCLTRALRVTVMIILHKQKQTLLRQALVK